MEITSVNPTRGTIGTLIAIYGKDFGGAQASSHRLGPSRITFPGVRASDTVPAIPTSWSDTSIVVHVPDGAVTGNVIVTVGDEAATFPFRVDEQ
jgi:hypothetical protein